jgi:hypothetical protein
LDSPQPQPVSQAVVVPQFPALGPMAAAPAQQVAVVVQALLQAALVQH